MQKRFIDSRSDRVSIGFPIYRDQQEHIINPPSHEGPSATKKKKIGRSIGAGPSYGSVFAKLTEKWIPKKKSQETNESQPRAGAQFLLYAIMSRPNASQPAVRTKVACERPRGGEGVGACGKILEGWRGGARKDVGWRMIDRLID